MLTLSYPHEIYWHISLFLSHDFNYKNLQLILFSQTSIKFSVFINSFLSLSFLVLLFLSLIFQAPFLTKFLTSLFLPLDLLALSFRVLKPLLFLLIFFTKFLFAIS